MEEGIRLYDAGDYDGAIKVYRQILEKEPDNPEVLYELALSMSAKKNYSEVMPILLQILQGGRGDRAAVWSLLGTTHDHLDELDMAEAAFRQGLEEFPYDGPLYFNLGINLTIQKKLEKAKFYLMNNLRVRPYHGNGWRILAVVLDKMGESQVAFLSYARFLTIPPSSPFSREAAIEIWRLLIGNINPEKKVISISENDKIGSLSMGIAGANRYSEEWRDKTDAQFFIYALEDLIAILSELSLSRERDNFWDPLLFDYFVEARKSGHLKTMANHLRWPLNEEETMGWLMSHDKEVTDFARFSSGWTRNLVNSKGIGFIRHIISELSRIKILKDGSPIISMLGGELRQTSDSKFRPEYVLVGTYLPDLKEVKLVIVPDGWVLATFEIAEDYSFTLYDIEDLLLDFPSIFDVDHASFPKGPRIIGTTHTFRVPAGELWLQFSIPPAPNESFKEGLERHYSDHARPEPNRINRLLTIGLSNEIRRAWEDEMTLGEFRAWARGED